MMRDPDPDSVARLDDLLAAIRERVLVMMATGRRRELHAVVVVDGHKVTPASHLVTRDYPLETSPLT